MADFFFLIVLAAWWYVVVYILRNCGGLTAITAIFFSQTAFLDFFMPCGSLELGNTPSMTYLGG